MPPSHGHPSAQPGLAGAEVRVPKLHPGDTGGSRAGPCGGCCRCGWCYLSVVEIFQMDASVNPLPTPLHFWVDPCFAKWGSIQEVIWA